MQHKITEDCPEFITKDSSRIREVFNPRISSDCHNLSLAQATLPPGASTIPHRHPDSEEIYTIISGSGVMNIEGETANVSAGEHVFIPAGARHGFHNKSGSDLIFYCFCSPAYSHEDTILD